MRSDSAIQPAIDYVEANLGERLELAHIANAAAMSVPNLYRLFYAATGHPIKTYIRNRRVSEAAGLLRHTALPAIEIAFDCGFDTYQTFLRTFKRMTGMTPGQYREAASIYSFEPPMDSFEPVSAARERETHEGVPDVRVIHLPPSRGVGYLHTASAEEGIEEAAMARFRALLAGAGVDISQVRLFGWNTELQDGDEASRFGYQLVAAFERAELAVQGDLQPVALPDGLHAAAWAPAGPASAIVACWNGLLGEWLPRSAFELRSGIFLEEYQQFGGRIARMKLYLPVARGREALSIVIAERQPVAGVAFLARGEHCESQADEAAVQWLAERMPHSALRLQLYISTGLTPDGEPYCRFVLAVDDDRDAAGTDGSKAVLAGGLFACLRTKVYGPMAGVMESVHRYLAGSPDYKPDASRSEYFYFERDADRAPAPRFADTRRPLSANVVCCVPVERR